MKSTYTTLKAQHEALTSEIDNEMAVLDCLGFAAIKATAKEMNAKPVGGRNREAYLNGINEAFCQKHNMDELEQTLFDAQYGEDEEVVEVVETVEVQAEPVMSGVERAKAYVAAKKAEREAQAQQEAQAREDARIARQQVMKEAGVSWTSTPLQQQEQLQHAQKETTMDEKPMGRPSTYKKSIAFDVKYLSSDLVEIVNRRKGTMTRRAYLEHLLRTHPELQNEFPPVSNIHHQNT